MHPHNKFRANRSIFREVMTFRIFSRWRPSAILNFEKFKFRINCDKTEIEYGRRRHVEFTSG